MRKTTSYFGLIALLAFFLYGMEISAAVDDIGYLGQHHSSSMAPLSGLVCESKTTEEYDDDNRYGKKTIESINFYGTSNNKSYFQQSNMSGAQAAIFLSFIRVLA